MDKKSHYVTYNKQQSETHLVQTQIEIQGNINLPTYPKKQTKRNTPKQTLQKPIEKLQNTTITKLYNQPTETQTNKSKEPQPHKKH